jgi:hypothetical protein
MGACRQYLGAVLADAQARARREVDLSGANHGGNPGLSRRRCVVRCEPHDDASAGTPVQPDWILKPKPTIKPVHSGEDGRSPGVLEDYEDKVEYTLEELTEIVETLSENYQSFSAYCRSVGLLVPMEKEVG